MDKRCLLMKVYGWSEDKVRKQITGARGWVYFNWARENEASVWGLGLKRTTPGYIKQEYQWLMKTKSA